MLTLTRRPGEAIEINAGGDKIRIVFLRQCAGGRGVIGIDAPRHVNIVRDEAKGKQRPGNRRA